MQAFTNRRLVSLQCLGLSLALHLLVLFPGLQDWLIFNDRQEKSQGPPVRLTYRVAPTAHEPSAGPGTRPREATQAPVFRRPKRKFVAALSRFPSAVKARVVAHVPRVQEITPAARQSRYPTSTVKKHRGGKADESGGPSEPASVSSGSASEGEGELSPPVLLKGPQRIPVPLSLKRHGGRFVISLKCAIGVDGSSQVSVLDGTGSIDLDEALQASFSNLPWYPGENRGVPVAVNVRLIIEAHWETGADEIEWRGLRPAASI